MLWSTSSFGVAVRPTSNESKYLKMDRYFWYTERCASSMTTRSKYPGPNSLVTVDPVDQVQDGRVGADIHPAVSGFVLQEIDGGRVREQGFERVGGLLHQGLPVRQEEHSADPSAALEEVGQGNNCSGLSGPGGHDEQGAALPVVLEGLGDPPNGLLLVGPARDAAVDRRGAQRFGAGAALG